MNSTCMKYNTSAVMGPVVQPRDGRGRLSKLGKLCTLALTGLLQLLCGTLGRWLSLIYFYLPIFFHLKVVDN